ENEFTIVGHRASIRSRMKAASSMARSTKNPFAMFGLFGSRSMSFRAANIVAANKMANFLSSVTRRLLQLWNEIQVREAEKRLYFFLFDKSTNSLTIGCACPVL